MATIDRVKLAALWLRQLICIHGPVGHATFVVRAAEEPDIYAFDFCRRCGKTLMKYSDA